MIDTVFDASALKHTSQTPQFSSMECCSSEAISDIPPLVALEMFSRGFCSGAMASPIPLSLLKEPRVFEAL
jgi:hypothetical protein